MAIQPEDLQQPEPGAQPTPEGPASAEPQAEEGAVPPLVKPAVDDEIVVEESTRRNVSLMFNTVAEEFDRRNAALLSTFETAPSGPEAPTQVTPGEGGKLSMVDVARIAKQAGFRGGALVTAVALTAPESGLDPTAHNDNPSTGDDSWGLWQINMRGDLGPDRRERFGLESEEELTDPLTNARAAFEISGGGTNWKPWGAFRRGLHEAHLDEARQAVAQLEAQEGGG